MEPQASSIIGYLAFPIVGLIAAFLFIPLFGPLLLVVLIIWGLSFLAIPLTKMFNKIAENKGHQH